jgi:hypothetical protein
MRRLDPKKIIFLDEVQVKSKDMNGRYGYFQGKDNLIISKFHKNVSFSFIIRMSHEGTSLHCKNTLNIRVKLQNVL